MCVCVCVCVCFPYYIESPSPVPLHAEEWIPPVAVAGGNVTVVFPETVALLDGSQSHDDYKDYTFLWRQIRCVCVCVCV